MKILNERELQQIASNCLSEFKDWIVIETIYFFCFPNIILYMIMYVYPKYYQCYKKDDSQWNQRLYLWKRIGFSKENSCYSIKHWEKKDLQLFETKVTEKIPDIRNAKEHYQSFIRKKNTESVKQSKLITQQPKNFENTDIVDIKSVIIEHRKALHNLSKTIRQAEKVSQVDSGEISNSPLYSEIKQKKIEQKNCKNNKSSRCI